MERIIEQYSERGFQFAYHLCGNAEEAKELGQEAFVRLISRWQTYDETQPVENWFLTILRNVYFDSVRRYERRHGVSLDAVLADPDGESFADRIADKNEEPLLRRLERQETADAVRRALAALTPEHRAILTLCDMQGLSYEKLTSVMDCPLGTVRSRLNRARAAFKKALLAQDQEVSKP